MSQELNPIANITLPIFALPVNTVLFPGVSVRHQLAANQTASTISKFNSLRKSFATNQNLHALHKRLGITERAADGTRSSPITIGLVPRRSSDSDAANATFLTSNLLGPTNAKDSSSSPVKYEDLLFDVGIIARVVRIERMLAGRYQVVVEGLNRLSIDKFINVGGSEIQADVSIFSDFLLHTDPNEVQQDGWSDEDQSQLDFLKASSLKLIDLMDSSSNPAPPGSLIVQARMLKRITNMIQQTQSKKAAGVLTDVLASILPLEFKEKITLLKALSLSERIKFTGELVSQKVSLIQVTDKINKSVEDNISKQQREFILRQQLNAIREELGDDGPNKNNDQISSRGLAPPKDDEDEEIEDLKKKLNDLDLGQEGRKVVQRELKRLKRMHPTQAEYQVCRTYLETLSEIPWNIFTNDNVQENPVIRARQILDEDHYGLEKVKKRLLEYLAVLHLKQKRQAALVKASDAAAQKTLSMDKSPILLLVGPPGVGKTSLAKSVARALGRQFHRISLGGVRDEAEIRGHRRTYVGAMPGVLVQALRKVGAMNPVILLDEIDKVSSSNFHGDPSAALLEVLDPEQNHTFTDHYVNFPVDLSKTLFIATANSLDDIPGPLLDRMETIVLEGYTYMEKRQIAHSYLLPKQMKNNGLEEGQLEVGDDALLKIITEYTREAGVRNLEREIGSLCRGKAVEYSETEEEGHIEDYVSAVKVEDVKKYLGMESYQGDIVNDEVDLYEDEKSGKLVQRHTYGVVNGLAYMGSGNGGLLMFEVTSMPGNGSIKYTGQLGSVISESAEIALSWVRSNAYKLGLTSSSDVDIVEHKDIHLHAPQGSIPKDGPSAGVAMTLALISLFSKRPIPKDLAMTGEMTLRGKILPVGGIREKLLGAHMSGIHRVLLPYHTRKIVQEECQFLSELKDFKVTYVKYIWDVLAQVWPEETYPLVLEGHL